MLKHWVLVLILLGCAPELLAAENPYLQQLIQQARVERLADHPHWHALLHYQKNLLFPGVTSLADAPAFFNAPEGKTDPQAELEATLASFFSTVTETDKRQNPQCAFIARYHWLKQQLGFDPQSLPEQPCPRFRAWWAGLNPHGLTLIFPASYVNNPASMYGHTLLRVDAKDQDEHTRLLAYAINYAAVTGNDGGVAFAVKGLLGGYPGVFSISPYYVKVKDYNDMENRDIWEYRLNFTAEELERLLMHIWELGQVYFDYYFLDENCSYHLLSLFEVARPGLKLTDQFRWWAIPSDTVRAVIRQAGLLEDVTYRPSHSTVIRHRLNDMDRDKQQIALDLAVGRVSVDNTRFQALSPADQAAVLELGFEYVEFQRLSGEWERKEAARRAMVLLEERSLIEGSSKTAPVPVPEVRPDEGHETARMVIGYGEKDGRRFTQFKIRPAYHDLLDPEGGYVRGAQIDFFALEFRRYEDDDVRLEDFTLIDIVSLSPRNLFLKPVSWRANVSRVRKRFNSVTEPLITRIGGGAGLSYEPWRNTITYGFVEASLEMSSHFEDEYAVGLGPSVGVIADVNKSWRIAASVRTLRFVSGDEHESYEASLDQRISLSKRNSLRLEVSRKRVFDYNWTSAVIGWQHYF